MSDIIGIPEENKKIFIFETDSDLTYKGTDFILTEVKTKSDLKKDVKIVELKSKKIEKNKKQKLF